MENLQCAHSWCNLVKGNSLREELTRKLVGIVLYQMELKAGGFAKRVADCLKDWRYKTRDTVNH